MVNRAIFTILALGMLGGGVFWYEKYVASQTKPSLQLSSEAKDYIANLKLSGVEIKAHESYLHQTVVEIAGNITNTGGRFAQVVDIYCVFYDSYGQLVLRERVPIVSARMGGLKPGETKAFRMPFDSLPESWDHQLPKLVIAGMSFQ